MSWCLHVHLLFAPSWRTAISEADAAAISEAVQARREALRQSTRAEAADPCPAQMSRAAIAGSGRFARASPAPGLERRPAPSDRVQVHPRRTSGPGGRGAPMPASGPLHAADRRHSSPRWRVSHHGAKRAAGGPPPRPASDRGTSPAPSEESNERRDRGVDRMAGVAADR
jgi:hypothetical protein